MVLYAEITYGGDGCYDDHYKLIDLTKEEIDIWCNVIMEDYQDAWPAEIIKPEHSHYSYFDSLTDWDDDYIITKDKIISLVNRIIKDHIDRVEELKGYLEILN